MYNLLRYNYLANQKYIDFLAKNPFSQGEKVISHILNAQHIWNARVSKTLSIYDIWQPHDLNQCTEINKENFDHSLKLIVGVSLQERHAYKEYTGEKFTNNVVEILNHVVIHAGYHRGQIAAKAKELKLSPPATDYINYLREVNDTIAINRSSEL